MSIIVPAILEQDKQNLIDKNFFIERIPGVERIHIDFADGKFVANTAVAAGEIELLNPAFHYEAHVMTTSPEDFLDYHIAGFKTVIVHYEAFNSEESIDEATKAIAKLGMTPGIAINPDTPVSVLRYFGDTVTHFLVMSVIPGKQGNPFIESSFEKIKELRKLLPHATIEVDGGVSSSNAKLLVDAGADLLVVGSAITKVSDPAAGFSAIEHALLSEIKN